MADAGDRPLLDIGALGENRLVARRRRRNQIRPLPNGRTGGHGVDPPAPDAEGAEATVREMFRRARDHVIGRDECLVVAPMTTLDYPLWETFYRFARAPLVAELSDVKRKWEQAVAHNERLVAEVAELSYIVEHRKPYISNLERQLGELLPVARAAVAYREKPLEAMRLRMVAAVDEMPADVREELGR